MSKHSHDLINKTSIFFSVFLLGVWSLFMRMVSPSHWSCEEGCCDELRAKTRALIRAKIVPVAHASFLDGSCWLGLGLVYELAIRKAEKL